MSSEEIKSIVPCQGEWIAKYLNETTEEEEEYPVACWVLIIDHLDENEQKEFGFAQFERVCGLVPIEGMHELAKTDDELPEGTKFIGYERYVKNKY